MPAVFFSQTHYVLLLCSFKEQLQQHVRVHAMEAVMACWELEQSLQSLTGKSAFQLAIFNGEMRASLFWKRASSVHYHVCSVVTDFFTSLSW
jgi:hypothetical protein